MGMQPDLTGILIYPPASGYLPPAGVVAAALNRLAAAYPAAPVWLATHSPEHREALVALLKAAESEASGAAKHVEFCDADGDGPGIVARLRSCFGSDVAAQSASSAVAVCYGFYAFFDAEIARALFEDHARYLAHITYSESVPAGFAPDFISREFIDALPQPLPPELAGQATAGVSGSGDLRAYAFKNIDRFDVEIYYRAPDLRQLRLDLSAVDERSVRLISALGALEPGLRFDNLEALLKAHPETLRPYPSYFEVELSSKFCEAGFRPGTLPEAGQAAAARRAGADFLPRELLEKLKADIVRHGLVRDVTVSFAGAGEPGLHPELPEIVAEFLQAPQVKQVIIETYGAGLDPSLVERLCALPDAQRLVLIVRVDSLRTDRYAELYGADRLADVQEFLAACERALVSAQQAETTTESPAIYVEMHRLAETEDELGEFMDRFENPEQPLRPLLRKFNRYIQRLPERRAADLTPLTRDFCWHLARDFYLTVDGRVPLCKQDPYGEEPAPIVQDFAASSVLEIVAASMPHHIASFRGEHQAIPMPCLQCDEWYTFNG